VLLPGFVSAGIVRLLSAQGKQSELERVIEALIFSFFTYLFYLLFFGWKWPIEWSVSIDAAKTTHYSLQSLHWGILFLLVFPCTLGFVWGIIKSKDLLLTPLRFLNITVRTSRESVWNDTFYNLEGTVQVGLADGRNLMGWVSRYSDSGGERSVFLESAAWVDAEGNRTEIEGSGVLLTEKSGIEYVMFLDNN
jgi:hypothetical protein